MNGLCQKLQEAITRNDYKLLSQLFWLPFGKSTSPYSSIIQSQSTDHLSLKSVTTNTSSSSLIDIINEHLKIFPLLSKGLYKDALGACTNSLLSMLRLLTSESNVELPLLKRICFNYYHLSILADTVITATTTTTANATTIVASNKEEAARQLSRVFTTCITDRASLGSSKKWASLNIANLLFRLYFRLGTVRLCTNIIRAIDTSMAGEFPPLERFPKPDAITYYYFRARLAVNKGQFGEASGLLETALLSCPMIFTSQRRTLMIYFITVRLIQGKIPQTLLLQRHDLVTEFHELVIAIKSGDMRLFDHLLAVNQTFYMKKEIFLIIQLYLRNLILRSFIKRIYTIGIASGWSQDGRLSLRLVLHAFKLLGIPPSPNNPETTGLDNLDEVECIIANLIYHGFIKGYISHEKEMLVLSKKSAFPPPNTVVVTRS